MWKINVKINSSFIGQASIWLWGHGCLREAYFALLILDSEVKVALFLQKLLCLLPPTKSQIPVATKQETSEDNIAGLQSSK